MFPANLDYVKYSSRITIQKIKVADYSKPGTECVEYVQICFVFQSEKNYVED
ncbi:MAG: hypothetical protein RL220_1066 [Bacteroidota bacterium]|jgi:hypothetical protein